MSSGDIGPKLHKTLEYTTHADKESLRNAEMLTREQIKKSLLISMAIFCFVQPVPTRAQDKVEFLNGSTVQGKILQIRKDEKKFDFETEIGAQTFTRTYPFSKVHAVNMKGKRYELTPKPAGSSGDSIQRTKAEVLAIIAEAGKTPPDWFDTTQLSYPDTLDLSWPLKPPTKGWHSHKNMGQYVWSVINENPKRWHPGIKLVHHCLKLHKDNPTLLERDMKSLGTLYFSLLRDYPRAAFWFEKANVSVTRRNGVRLAECYWRMGNRMMALDMMRGKTLPVEAVKLLGDMDELTKALKVTRAYSKSRRDYHAYILAGDALRKVGKLDQAIEYYQRVLNTKKFRNEEYKKRFKTRASESIAAIRLNDKADVNKVGDGRYSDSTTGYNGKLTVEVTVAGGRMKSVKVTAHKEKQYYTSLVDTPKELIAKQTVQSIDAVSGATITSQAIVNATAKALAQGAE